MKENYYTLLVCILRPVTSEQAFAMMHGVFPKVVGKRKAIDIHELIQLQSDGLSYQQIGEKYNLSPGAVKMRIKRYMKEVKY